MKKGHHIFSSQISVVHPTLPATPNLIFSLFSHLRQATRELTLMEIRFSNHQQHNPSLLLGSTTRFLHSWKGITNSKLLNLPCRCSVSPPNITPKIEKLSVDNDGRRLLMSCFFLTAAEMWMSDVAGAVSTSRRALKGAKVPESEFRTLPNGLKYYDLKVGGGAEAVKGSRVAVHYVAKWKNITFMTSRQGLGVGGGTPYGFDVGESERGRVLKGLDLGVEGMRVGGQRVLIVPPELAYGSKGVQEIPPNATIELDVELLSIKQSPFGSPVKIVEG